MTQIYGRATRVLVWLGEQHEIDNAVNLQRAVSTYRTQQDKGNLAWLRRSTWMPVEASIGRLLGEEYWKRTWIIQEIGAAAHITVHFGKQSLDWVEFLDLVQLFRQARGDDPSSEHVLKLSRLRKSRYLEGEAYSFGDLLSTFRHSFSSVDHDKIYAFLGLANDYFTDVEGAFAVNYTASRFDLYHGVIKFLAHSHLTHFLHLLTTSPVNTRIHKFACIAAFTTLIYHKPIRIYNHDNRPPTIRNHLHNCQTSVFQI